MVDERVLKQRLAGLIQDGDVEGLKAMHDSGDWTDVDMMVGREDGPGGLQWSCTALAMAASFHQLEVMRLLIELKAEVNDSRMWHVLPSNVASGDGNIQMLELLNKHGCHLSRGDTRQFTPAHAAATNNQLQTIRYLRSCGASMLAKDVDGLTPADYTTKQGQVELMREVD
jgi:ankyrin repeat protein